MFPGGTCLCLCLHKGTPPGTAAELEMSSYIWLCAFVSESRSQSPAVVCSGEALRWIRPRLPKSWTGDRCDGVSHHRTRRPCATNSHDHDPVSRGSTNLGDWVRKSRCPMGELLGVVLPSESAGEYQPFLRKAKSRGVGSLVGHPTSHLTLTFRGRSTSLIRKGM